jgi:N-acetylglucosamine transport system substrate-binding protein
MKRTLVLVLTVLLVLCGFAIAEEKTNNEVSILWDGGGNGEFVNYAIEQMEAKGAKFDIEYTPKAHEVFQPMLVGGNPPDIVMVQFGFFNHFEAIQAGAFQEIDDLLNVVVDGSDKMVGEIANPDIVNAVMVDGHHYLLSSNMNVGGMYYNKTMFDEHGWTVPTTWDEFIALCEEIKTTTDIAPIAYPGMYPYYFDCFFFPQVLALGEGSKTLNDMNNMVEGFWTSEPAKEAAKRVEYMCEQGYFLENMIGLSHTETQMEFINGNVAMLCCGSWLENEMAGNWPDDFDLHFMVTPAVKNAEDEKFVQLSGHLVCFPAAAKNTEWNKDFVAAYYSEESAVRVAKECGVVITPEYIASNEEIKAALPASVVETFTLTNENSGYSMLATKWYSEWNDQRQALTDQLVDGEISAEGFCETMEANSAAVRENPDIVKYTVG